MFEFGFEFEFEFELDFELDLELDFEPKFKLKSSEPSLVRYGAYTYNCMRYPSLTLSQQLFTENNLVVSQRIRSENQDEKILKTASY